MFFPSHQKPFLAHFKVVRGRAQMGDMMMIKKANIKKATLSSSFLPKESPKRQDTLLFLLDKQGGAFSSCDIFQVILTNSYISVSNQQQQKKEAGSFFFPCQLLKGDRQTFPHQQQVFVVSAAALLSQGSVCCLSVTRNTDQLFPFPSKSDIPSDFHDSLSKKFTRFLSIKQKGSALALPTQDCQVFFHCQ